MWAPLRGGSQNLGLTSTWAPPEPSQTSYQPLNKLGHPGLDVSISSSSTDQKQTNKKAFLSKPPAQPLLWVPSASTAPQSCRMANLTSLCWTPWILGCT